MIVVMIGNNNNNNNKSVVLLTSIRENHKLEQNIDPTNWSNLWHNMCPILIFLVVFVP